MDHANYSTARLGDVDDSYYCGVSCQSCMRSGRLSLIRLRAMLGDDYPLVRVVTRLRCRTCGSKQVTVTFLNPSQSVGSLSHLFQQEPV
jgi:hypothetical protein